MATTTVPKPSPLSAPAPAPPAATPTAAVSQDDKTMALLAHLLGIFTGFIGALVIWIVKKDQSPFVERHAREALNFQITAAIVAVVGFILIIVLVGILVLLALGIAVLVFCIMGTIAASNGQEYRYPVALRLIKGPAGSA